MLSGLDIIGSLVSSANAEALHQRNLTLASAVARNAPNQAEVIINLGLAQANPMALDEIQRERLLLLL